MSLLTPQQSPKLTIKEIKDWTLLGKIIKYEEYDGRDYFPSEKVLLSDQTYLCKINGTFYVDCVYQLKRLDKQVIMRYNLSDYFECIEDTTQQKRGKTNETTTSPVVNSRGRKSTKK